MSKNQYDAPAMEVVEFGKEDIVCVISGYDVVTPGGEHVGGGGIGEWSPDLPWAAIRTKYVSTLGASAQVDAPFSFA